MAETWNPPGTETKVKYRIVQFMSGEWAIERSETACVAWFPNRALAIDVCKSMLPANAEREM